MRNIVLLILYSLFFSVELLHNFGSEKRPDSVAVNIPMPDHAKSHHATSKCDKPTEQSKLNFRLNKRFQPSYIPSATIFPQKFFIENTVPDYSGTSTESLSNIFLLTQSLRAPPVV